MTSFFEGFLLQASVILALGAQNLFVLDCGLKRRSPLLVGLVCAFCDALLIALGVLGAASVFLQWPLLKVALGMLGVAFLAYYSLLKVRDGLYPHYNVNEQVPAQSSPRQLIGMALGFSLLNPHVYLDTVVIIGGFSAKFPSLPERVLFGAGAECFSVIWFLGLALGASYMSTFLKNQRAMQLVSLVSGVILLTLSYKLGHDVYAWLRQMGI